MNSSTSSSEPADPRWRRWLIAFTALTLGGFALVFALVVVIDPYSSGRLTPLTRIDIAIANRLYANAGRVRDARFDSAILGNSHAVRIDPARLSAATGRRFVQLAIEGTFPHEHYFLARMFARQHRAAAYVLVLDNLSCEATTAGKAYEVPRWLYDSSTRDYLSHILSPAAVRASLYRAGILLGLRTDALAANGYDPRPWSRADLATLHERMLTQPRPADGAAPSAPFPLLDELAATAHELDPQSHLLLVFTPVYRNMLPLPGSAAQARLDACKAKARAIAQSRNGFGFLDLQADDAIAADPDNFVDGTHFVDAVARNVELKIAEQLKWLAARRQ